MESAMAAGKKKPSAPLTFDLPESLISKIALARKGHDLGTASEVVRLALARFDLNNFRPAREAHGQISVRITGATRVALRRMAKEKNVSAGELIRAALEALPIKPAPARKRR